MDEDSGRGSQRSMPKRDGHARHQLDDKSPSGVPNPLPRRSAQGHLEPQLRHPGGSGTGTPFAAFAAKDDAGDDGAAGHDAGKVDDGDGDGDAGGGDAGGPVSGVADGSADVAETSRAADFRRGARRGHTPRPATPAN